MHAQRAVGGHDGSMCVHEPFIGQGTAVGGHRAPGEHDEHVAMWGGLPPPCVASVHRARSRTQSVAKTTVSGVLAASNRGWSCNAPTKPTHYWCAVAMETEQLATVHSRFVGVHMGTDTPCTPPGPCEGHHHINPDREGWKDREVVEDGCLGVGGRRSERSRRVGGSLIHREEVQSVTSRRSASYRGGMNHH